MEVFSLVFHLPLSFYNELNEVISRNKMKVRAIRIMTHIIIEAINIYNLINQMNVIYLLGQKGASIYIYIYMET